MKKLIKDISGVQSWFYLPSEKDWDINYIQAKNFDDFWDLKEELIKEIKSNKIEERYLLKKWDILFSAKWSRNFATVYKEEYWLSIASSTFFTIKLETDLVLPEYLAIILIESQKESYFKNNFWWWTIQSIPKKVLENFEINIIPIEKQQEIIELYNLYKSELKIYEELKNKKELLINKIILKSNK